MRSSRLPLLLLLLAAILCVVYFVVLAPGEHTGDSVDSAAVGLNQEEAVGDLPTDGASDGASGVLPSGIQVYFSRSCGADNTTGGEAGNLDTRMAGLIATATDRIDAALHELESVPIADALVAAHRRGVQVRVVAESDYRDNSEMQQVIAAGVPVVFDERSALMHNKFLVIDRQTVWTGSFNATYNGACRNDNNALVIASREVADNFTAEFEEMFDQGEFGARSPSATPHTLVKLDGADLYTYFSPEDDIPPKIIRFLRAAGKSIQFMAFSFTDDEIGEVLVNRYRSGVQVEGVMESRGSKSPHSELRRLSSAGITVLSDGNPYILHHKVFIIDTLWTITGSYNFSASAARSNDENVVIIKNRSVALRFLEEYQRVRQEALQGRGGV
jgi:phosphatidylserine/phosphatidylglycerophosphate/cardiolipin synthase-like enzyme